MGVYPIAVVWTPLPENISSSGRYGSAVAAVVPYPPVHAQTCMHIHLGVGGCRTRGTSGNDGVGISDDALVIM